MANKNYTVEVSGVRELVKALDDLDDRLADLEDLHSKSAKIVYTASARNVNSVTGKLKRSHKVLATAKKGVIKAGVGRVAYARVNHWGWRVRNYAANNFLYDARDSEERKVYKVYTDGIPRIIKKAKL